jgi:L-ascorbate 6-phosphate lactonase
MRGKLGSVYKRGAALQREMTETTLSDGSIAFWHLGQAGVAIKGARSDSLIYIDPYLTFSIEDRLPGTEFRRGFPPPLEPAEIVNPKAVMITHYHDDHLDLETITTISRTFELTVFVVPAPSISVLSDAGINLDRVLPAKDGDRTYLDHGTFELEPVAVAHVDYQLDEHQDHHYLGYCMTVDGIRLFHAGDCLVDDRLVARMRRFKPDIVFLPINGRDFARTARGIVGNMNYREAADFAVSVGADLVVPMHYDLFANNRDNPAYFVDYLFHAYPMQRFHMMVPGERFIYMQSE